MTPKSMAETMQERLNDPAKPDKYTLAWWDSRFDEIKQAYGGASHSINLAVANSRDCWVELKVQRAVNETLRSELEISNAMVGKLQSELTVLAERVDRMAEWINTQRIPKGK